MAIPINSNVFKTGTKATTAATADQSILSYTVSADKTFFLCGFQLGVKLTTFAATATDFGSVSIRQNGTALNTYQMVGPGTPAPVFRETEGLPFQAGDVITVVCTPSGTTPFTWEANIIGYEA